MRQHSDTNKFQIDFPSIRGGDLTIIVSTVIHGSMLEARTQGVQIFATNPSRETVKTRMPHKILSKIAMQESNGMRQFLADNGKQSFCPLWSGDQKGGVGIMQLTVPLPTDDEVWDWTRNVAKGIEKFKSSVSVARNYPKQLRESPQFHNLVAKYNEARAAQKLPPVTVTVPEFTTGDFENNPKQLELDAIRGYNGFAGYDLGLHLHEFRIARDAQGLLIVDVPPGTTMGTARWERVPASDRPSAGDRNYVENVLKQVP